MAGEMRSRRCVATAVRTPPTTTRNSHYVSNREPLAPSALVKLPVGSISPKGWLHEYLKRQKNGLTGNLGMISAWLQKNGNAWLSGDGKGEWGWEEVPYWLKGYGNIGYILEDEQMIAETKVWIEGALASQRDDGDFGPDRRYEKTGRRDYWSNMIMLFCLQSNYEYCADKRVLDLMTRYFRHLASVPDEDLFTGFWDKMRGGDNLASIYWLYNHTGDPFLLDVAEKVHRNTADWKMRDELPNWHNVNIAQGFNEPAIYSQQSHDKTDLTAAYDNFHLIRDQYGQMPGGMFAGDEGVRKGHDDPHQCIETCGMVEQMLSDEQLLAITGDCFWADNCEDVAFNSFPAAAMPDFRSLRYLTGVNHVLSDSEDHSPGVDDPGPRFVMNPLSSRCCQHNHSHGWPYFCEHLWFATPDNGLAAVMYSAGTVTAMVGTGVEVSIEENTRYPFDEEIEFVIRAAEPAEFPLYLRIPGWCNAPVVKVNGLEIRVSAKPCEYIRLDNKWHSGDNIVLSLPMETVVRRWVKNHNCASVHRGPIAYSLKIEEKLREVPSDATALKVAKWQDDLDLDAWPSWEIRPGSPWNYALVLDEENPDDSFKVVLRQWPSDDMPFTHEGTPVVLEGHAQQIPAWTLDEHRLAGELQDSPVNSEEPVQSVALVPMGAARIRIGAFPVAGENSDAVCWRDASESGCSWSGSARRDGNVESGGA